MSATYVLADPHFGHHNIITFLREDGTLLRPGFATIEEHDEFIVDTWNHCVRVSDTGYILGDVGLAKGNAARKALWERTLGRLNGHLRLVRGNHDIYKIDEYLKYFDEIHGTRKLDRWLLSHFPVHPDSLPAKTYQGNVHGHIHERRVMKSIVLSADGGLVTSSITEADRRYINVAIERLPGYAPIPLEQLAKFGEL